MANVGIALIHWRNLQDITSIINQIQSQSYKKYKVIIVNNGDLIELQDALRCYDHNEIIVIDPKFNTGFSGACNLAVKYAARENLEYIWFLNSDTHLIDGCLDTLVNYANIHNDFSLFSPIIYCDTPDRPVWIAGGKFDPKDLGFGWFTSERDGIQHSMNYPDTFMLPGTALFARCSDLLRIGPLDERLFAYHEDVDLCMRATRMKMKMALVENSKIIHKHPPVGLMRPHVVYYSTRNNLLLAKKHASFLVYVKQLYWSLIRMKQQINRHKEDPQIVQSFELGWWHGILGISGEMRHTPKFPTLMKILTYFVRS